MAEALARVTGGHAGTKSWAKAQNPEGNQKSGTGRYTQEGGKATA